MLEVELKKGWKLKEIMPFPPMGDIFQGLSVIDNNKKETIRVVFPQRYFYFARTGEFLMNPKRSLGNEADVKEIIFSKAYWWLVQQSTDNVRVGYLWPSGNIERDEMPSDVEDFVMRGWAETVITIIAKEQINLEITEILRRHNG